MRLAVEILTKKPVGRFRALGRYCGRGRQRAARFARKTFTKASSRLETVYLCAGKRVRKAWNGKSLESPKVIVHDELARAFRKCVVHLPPISVTAVLSSLNLATYFIGNQYQGFNDGVWQDVDNLALQVAAKLYELCIIASPATVLMDVLRQELLFGSTGLPLGILAAKTRFVDATFITSPDFRCGIRGLPRRKAWFVGILIFLCSILALLSGPSSALLMLPQRHDDWPAGGATYFLVGTNESIWPSQLDKEAIGGVHCQTPSQGALEMQLLNMSSCVWAGYPSILQFFQSKHFNYKYSTITIQDGLVVRDMVIRDEWAFAVHAPTCLYSEALSAIWYSAMFYAPSATPGSLEKFANLQYRQRGGNVMTLPSLVPVVRTTCFMNSSVTFADVVNKTYYPLQPLDGSEVTAGRQFSFDTSTVPASNAPHISTVWLETPETESIGTRIDGDQIDGRSSAYLNVQIPTSENNTAGILASCSIDARWLKANIVGTGGIWTGGDISYAVENPVEWQNPISYPEQDEGKSRSVRLKMDWLNALTPEMANNTNTLSSLLTLIGADNSTGFIGNWSDPRNVIETIVSAVVADGMSRSGFERNGGSANATSYPWNLDQDPGAALADSVLDGTYVLPPMYGYDADSADITEMRWSTTVSGIGYRADSAAYYLALVVLFLHLVIALSHIFWVFWRPWRPCETSTAWSSLTDLLVLALGSTPPADSAILDNATAGIQRYATLREGVRIRAEHIPLGVSGQDQGGVKMVLSQEYSASKHDEVVVGRSY
ncbi:hypothetical protein Daus18300_009308 [Diaporthe australafricana]|uniref:Uncharacterized protein n=1 Tax=Diaporthe australafricana TaxID=127596 RepID=A0ABR3WES5_9PEZI